MQIIRRGAPREISDRLGQFAGLTPGQVVDDNEWCRLMLANEQLTAVLAAEAAIERARQSQVKSRTAAG
jgi:hypothetical protein